MKIRATIEVNFRRTGASFDAKAEQRRTEFNIAVRDLQRNDGKSTAHAVETIERLANEKLPAAIYLKAIWMREGKLALRNDAESLKLLTKAADKHYGPAMYELGRMYIEGRDVPAADPGRGMKLVRDAASLGSKQAEFYLAARYETGEGLPRDPDRARRYFHLCAAARAAMCQYRLGRMMLLDTNRQEDDYIQGLAWLQLAAEQGMAEARALLDKEMPKVDGTQLGWLERLKPQLAQKP